MSTKSGGVRQKSPDLPEETHEGPLEPVAIKQDASVVPKITNKASPDEAEWTLEEELSTLLADLGLAIKPNDGELPILTSSRSGVWPASREATFDQADCQHEAVSGVSQGLVADELRDDEEITQLLADFIDDDAYNRNTALMHQQRGDASKKLYDANEETQDWPIDELLTAQLDAMTAETSTPLKPREMELLMNMFSSQTVGARKAGLPKIISLLSRVEQSIEALRMAFKVLNEFVEVHMLAGRETTDADAEAFIQAMHAAMARHSLPEKCRLAVEELWAANKLRNTTMANACIDHLINAICDADDDVSARQIEQAVDYIATMPQKHRTKVATALYERAPKTNDNRLRALEAIANKNLALPDNQKTMALNARVNQEILELRMAEVTET